MRFVRRGGPYGRRGAQVLVLLGLAGAVVHLGGRGARAEAPPGPPAGTSAVAVAPTSGAPAPAPRVVAGWLERLGIPDEQGRRARKTVLIEPLAERVPWQQPPAADRLGRVCYHLGCIDLYRVATTAPDVPSVVLVGSSSSCTAPVEATIELVARDFDRDYRPLPDARRLRGHVVGACAERVRGRLEFGFAGTNVRVHGLARTEWRRVPAAERAGWLARSGVDYCAPADVANLEVLEVPSVDVAVLRSSCTAVTVTRGHSFACGIEPYAVVEADAATFLLYYTAQEDDFERIDPGAPLPCNARPVGGAPASEGARP